MAFALLLDLGLEPSNLHFKSPRGDSDGCSNLITTALRKGTVLNAVIRDI